MSNSMRFFRNNATVCPMRSFLGYTESMLDHHIQRAIVYKLAFSEGLRFSQLKPDTLENKAFDYHLKKVIRAGYVAKSDTGRYQLTAEGQLMWRMSQQKPAQADRAYSTLLLAVQRPDDGAWLLYRRRTHPMIGLAGFMHAKPSPDADSTEVAKQTLYDQTGLTGEFVVHAHGYFRVFRGGVVEGFTHFTLLRGTDIQGELHQNSELAEYYWDTDPDFSAPDMLPNTQILHKMLAAPEGSFVEQTFDIE